MLHIPRISTVPASVASPPGAAWVRLSMLSRLHSPANDGGEVGHTGKQSQQNFFFSLSLFFFKKKTSKKGNQDNFLKNLCQIENNNNNNK